MLRGKIKNPRNFSAWSRPVDAFACRPGGGLCDAPSRRQPPARGQVLLRPSPCLRSLDYLCRWRTMYDEPTTAARAPATPGEVRKPSNDEATTTATDTITPARIPPTMARSVGDWNGLFRISFSMITINLSMESGPAFHCPRDRRDARRSRHPCSYNNPSGPPGLQKAPSWQDRTHGRRRPPTRTPGAGPGACGRACGRGNPRSPRPCAPSP